jgi:hypothetical protein
MLVVAAAVSCFLLLTKQTVRDSNGLSVISGQMRSYSFTDGRRGHHHYVIRLMEYQAAFQIPADFLSYFSKDRFQADLQRGSTISVSIPKGNEESLTSDQEILVFSVRAKGETYLDEKDAVRAYNSWFPALMSALLFVMGFGLLWAPKLSGLKLFAGPRH